MDPSQPRSVTVVGTVASGVEHRSVVLRADDGTVWQVGAARAYLVGCRVRVVGRTRPGLLTTAMQGTLLKVESVEVLQGQPGEPGSSARRL